jgi:hypothetical protein
MTTTTIDTERKEVKPVKRTVMWYIKECLELTESDINLRRQWINASGELKVGNDDDVLEWLDDHGAQLSDQQPNDKLIAAISRHKQARHIVYLDLGEQVLWVSPYDIVQKPDYAKLTITCEEDPISEWDFEEQRLGASRMHIAHAQFFSGCRPGNLLLFLDDYSCKLNADDMKYLFDLLSTIPQKGAMYCEWRDNELECIMYNKIGD